MMMLSRLAHWLAPARSFHDEWEAAQSRGCYAGHWGTSCFYIDGDHDMYVGSGQLHGRLYDTIGPNRARDLATIRFRGPVRAPEDSSRLFSGTDEIYTSERTYLYGIYGVDMLDTSSVTDMRGMFANDRFVTTLDLSTWDVCHVQDFSLMFHNLVSLKSLDVHTWETHDAVNMTGMFDGDHRITHLDVRGWDTAHVKKMDWMFTDTSSLHNLDLSNFDMSQVKTMNAMFLWTAPSLRVRINPTIPLTKQSAILEKHLIK